MTPEDVNNIDEASLFYHAHLNKTLGQGKFYGCKIQKDRLTLALVVNTTNTDKLKHVIIYKSLRPRCFERLLPTNYVWWFANQMARMISCEFKSWMMNTEGGGHWQNFRKPHASKYRVDFIQDT